MLELTPTATAILVLAAAMILCTGCLILALRPIARNLWRIQTEINAVEATVNTHRQDVDQRLTHLDDRLREHTHTVRETTATAPAAVIAERDKIAEDYQRLAAAAAVAIQYRPNPDAGAYVKAGVDEAIAHVKAHVQAAL